MKRQQIFAIALVLSVQQFYLFAATDEIPKGKSYFTIFKYNFDIHFQYRCIVG